MNQNEHRVYSNTCEEHLKDVETVLEALREHQLKAHTELWNFNQICRMTVSLQIRSIRFSQERVRFFSLACEL